MPTLLEDFLSHDTSRVLHATWEIIRSRDEAQLNALLPHIAQIRTATERLDMGGMLRSNAGNVDHAIAKLESYRRRECWCASYPGMDQYEPAKEQDRGHIRIMSASEPGWSMSYVCECTVCGRSSTSNRATTTSCGGNGCRAGRNVAERASRSATDFVDQLVAVRAVREASIPRASCPNSTQHAPDDPA